MSSSAPSDPSSSKPRFSVVIPVFNEEECLEQLNQRMISVMDSMGESFEIIYVNDGSRDRSTDILDAFSAADERVRVIHFTRNFGQHPAVYAGFDHVRGEIIATLDADLQNPPEEIPKLVEALMAGGHDVVAGVRSHRHDSILRTLPSRFVNWMVGKLTGVPLRDYGCLLRVYRREVIEMLLKCEERTKYFTALISWLGVDIAEVDVEHAPRAGGESKYHFLKLVSMNFDLLTGYSIFPIQMISLGGILFASLGICFSIFFLALGLVYYDNDTWWILLGFSCGFFLFGLLFMALGFIGEYIGRIMIEVKDRPYYLIRKGGRTPDQVGAPE